MLHSALTTTLVFAVACGLAAQVAAQPTVTWTGSQSTDWNDADNWSPGSVPGDSDEAIIDTVKPNAPTLTNFTEIDALLVGDSKTGDLTIEATLIVNENMAIGQEGGTGTVTVALDTGALHVASDLNIAARGTGTLTIGRFGSVTVGSQNLIMGLDADAVATLNIGAAATDTAVAPGTLSVDTIEVVEAKRADFVFNHRSGGYTFAPSIEVDQGSATISLLSGVTNFTGDLTSFGGSVEISDGTMVLRSDLVASDISLGGGTTGGLTVRSGSTVSTPSLLIGTGSGNVATVEVTGDDGNGNPSTLTVTDTLTVGVEGTGTLVLSDGAVLNAPATIVIAEKGSSTGTLALGAVSGADAAALGTFNADISFGSGDGTLLFNHTATETDPFSSTVAISGSGTISALAGFTELSGDISGFDGALFVDGGSLLITEDIKARSLTVGDTGTDAAFVFGDTVTATISGDATIGVEAGSSGTVTVAGATADGSTIVAATLKVSDDLVIGGAGTGTLVVNESGVVSVDGGKGRVTIAESAGSNGTLIIGSPVSGTPLGVGTVEADLVAFGDGGGTALFNHSDDSGDFVFDLPFSGNGLIDHQAGATELSADSKDFTGTVILSGGQLTVSGTLPGSITLGDGTLSVTGTLSGDVEVEDGTLAGTGTVEGTITVDNGGTIAPGTSDGTAAGTAVGTLTTADMTFESGSVYAVEIDSDGNTDLINASGTVTLNGGTVSVVADGFFSDTSFVILTAADVTGEFSDTVLGATTFIDYVLSYDDTDVTLTQTVNQSFGAVGTSENHQQVAAALTSLPFEEAVVQHALASATEEEARAIFDSLSGEIHASVQGALMDNDREISAAINRRLGGPFYSLGRPGMDGPQNGAWIAGYGGWNDIDATGNTDAASNDYGGVIAGFDRAFGETWRLGIFGAYGSTDVDQSGRASSADVDSFSAGLYGQANVDALFINLGGVFSWHDVDTSRAVPVRSAVQNLTANYDANSWQLFAEAGYRFAWDGTTLEPFGGVSYLQLDRDGFTEAGGSAALRASANTEETTFTTLGVRVGQEVTDTFRVQGTAAWRHTFGDVDPTADFTLAGSDPFTVAGAPIAEDALLVEAAVELDLATNVTLGVGYGGRFGDGTTANQVQGYLRLAF
ncbi:MAG: autotransporter domain-containing protein [Pseudomonadota bacterium]